MTIWGYDELDILGDIFGIQNMHVIDFFLKMCDTLHCNISSLLSQG